jgi:hypothetical protein
LAAASPTAKEANVRLRQDDVTWQELDGHVVVLDLRASVYLEINASGAVLFPLLVTGTDESRLVQALQTEYAVSWEVAQRDVRSFVDILKRRGLLEP